MLDHVSIGVRDIARTKRFYDAALSALGYRCLSEAPDYLAYGADRVVFCFSAPDRDGVDQFHAAALEAGGRDNGKPGLRPEYSGAYYAAFAFDPDGYRVEAYCGTPE